MSAQQHRELLSYSYSGGCTFITDHWQQSELLHLVMTALPYRQPSCITVSWQPLAESQTLCIDLARAYTKHAMPLPTPPPLHFTSGQGAACCFRLLRVCFQFAEGLLLIC